VVLLWVGNAVHAAAPQSQWRSFSNMMRMIPFTTTRREENAKWVRLLPDNSRLS